MPRTSSARLRPWWGWVEVQAPAEVAADSAPPAVADGEFDAAPAPLNSPPPAIVSHRQRRSIVPRPLRRGLERAGRWSHSRPALWIGSAITAAAVAAVVVAVVQVGIRGVSAPNTHYYYPQYDAASYTPPPPSIFPQPASEVGPPSIELPDANGLSGSLTIVPAVPEEQMAQAVLQSYDLDGAFSLEGEAPNGNDPRNGLLASFEATYQRDSSSIDQSYDFPGLKAVFSDVAVYSDAATASAQMNDVDITQLGLEAGLPDMVTTPLAIPSIGDESRAARLIGTAGGMQVEVVLIQFRVGGSVGVVGAAAGLGVDGNLSDQAVALAQTQMRNMLGLTPGGS